MLKIGITGQSGFIGYHLYHYLKTLEDVSVIEFEDNFFEDRTKLEEFSLSCDIIFHLAAVNRNDNQQELYDTNIRLVEDLIDANKATGSKAKLVFSSSTQEKLDNKYGASKQEGRELLQKWAKENNSDFLGLIIPNVFGPFSTPFHNTFIATFCHQLLHGDEPKIIEDNDVKLIYVGTLVRQMLQHATDSVGINTIEITPSYSSKVSDIIEILKSFRSSYIENGIIPDLSDSFIKDLFLTFSSFIDFNTYFPKKLLLHTDNRGSFSEIIKTNCKGQTSYSSTNPGITRGNHYHTRKFERFTVIKGSAMIRIRKIGSKKIFEYKLDGKQPAYVDMPVHFTHNVTNIGNSELITIFWINEEYNPEDPDTFYVEV